MPIPCLPTETSYDVQCPICGRGFLLLTEPTLHIGTGSQRNAARKALIAQHKTCTRWGSAHPDEVFDLPGWDGEPQEAGDAFSLLDAFRMACTA